MNILVTGGAGYIGSHFVKQLGEETDHNIYIIDNLSTGFVKNILFGKLFQVDLSEIDKIENILINNKINAVVHFAASIVVPESVENPLKYYFNNTINTANLVKLCIKHNINKFIFSSTAAVYDESTQLPVKESNVLNPINPYGMSKLMSERIIQDITVAHKDFKYVILRYFNVAGADIKGRIGQCYPNATHLIKVAAETALGNREKMYIYGDDFNTADGTGVRDYIHVDDLADALIKALNYLDNNASDIFNCGYGFGYSVKEVINTMKKVSGKDFAVEIVEKRQGDPACIIADNSKIIEKIGWNPKYNDLEIICKTALNWECERNNYEF
ncbi:MAG: UDP-glucose 4-epimerase GalE [bacterium]